ncbi:MAG: hypothetical protein K8R39_09560 [Arcobacteraceae bacterium]|nr:hypothetical protein [Arcobacteraceae bacterium]
MTTNTNYSEHVSIMKNLKMADSFYEVREPFKESFEKIYEEAQSQKVTVSNAKEFLNSLSKDELSTLQNYTRLVNDIDVDSLSDEGAYNLLVHHYEKYDFNKDGVVEDGIAKTQSLIPQSMDSTTKQALVETFNSMDFGEVMMASITMFPKNIKIVDGEIVHSYQNYTYEDIKNNVETILDPKNKTHSTAEFKSTISSFFELLTKNYNKIQENEATLASYTKTNTTTPVSNTTNTQLPPVEEENNISPEDEALFKSITKDNYVSYDEIKNLSYEQIVQIKDFVMKKDEKNNYIQSSFMDHDKKAGMLLGTTAISDNNTFNKAIFNIARKIDDEKILETFMYDMTGTKWSDKLMAYPEFQEIDYSKKDVKEYLADKLASYQIKLDTATDKESKEFYQDMINKLQGLSNHYKSLQGESLYDDTDPFERIRALVKDLISVIKTGFTLEELEYIEKLIEEIRKLLKERADADKATSNEDIDKQIKAIEDALLALEKRIHGVAIIEMDGETTQQQENNDSDIPPEDGFHFEERLNAIEKRIDNMKNGDLKLPTDTSNKDEEELEEEKEW